MDRIYNMFSDDAKPRVYIFTPVASCKLQPLYAIQVKKIEDEIRDIFGSYPVSIDTICYDPLTKEDVGDGIDKQVDPDFRTPKGKVLVQYRPGSDSDGQSRYRVWFAGQLLPDGGDTWTRNAT